MNLKQMSLPTQVSYILYHNRGRKSNRYTLTIFWCWLRSNKTGRPATPWSYKQGLIKRKWSVGTPSSRQMKLKSAKCLAWASWDCLKWEGKNICSIISYPWEEFYLERKKKVKIHSVSPKGNRKQSSNARPWLMGIAESFIRDKKIRVTCLSPLNPQMSLENTGAGWGGVVSKPTGVCEISPKYQRETTVKGYIRNRKCDLWQHLWPRKEA